MKGRRRVRKRSLATGVVEATQDLTSVVGIEGRGDIGNDAKKKDLNMTKKRLITLMYINKPSQNSRKKAFILISD